MPKLIPRIVGGLGNQLFSYAAARRLAMVNDAELVLDDISGFAYDSQYQRHFQLDHFNISFRKASSAERLEPFSKLRRALKRHWNRYLPFDHRKYLIEEGVDYDSRLLDYKVVGTVYIEGYWQSEKYFKDIEGTIREDLFLEPLKDDNNAMMADKIRSCMAVAVHVRFFDQPGAASINNAPNKYYHSAIKLMEQFAPNAHYFLFSDQPEAARTDLPVPDDRITIVAHNKSDKNAYADLWLMTLCKYHIIANSTFSWWGAWLANYPDKQVIAPGFEKRFGESFWGFDGLLPVDWIKL